MSPVKSDPAETILVDGILRSRQNSLGDVIDPTEDGLRAFWRWFGNSRVTDHLGRPLVVFHGTPNGDFDVFDTRNRHGQTADYNAAMGAHFTEEEFVARRFSDGLYGVGTNPQIFAVYLKIDNPLCDGEFVSAQEAAEESARHEAQTKEYNQALETWFRGGLPLEEMARLIESEGLDAALAKDDERKGPAPVAPVRSKRRNPITEADLVLRSCGTDYTVVANMSPGKRKAMGEKAQDTLTNQGFDGVYYQNGNNDEGRGSHTWIAFKPQQIKATNNFGNWNPQDERFRPTRAIILQNDPALRRAKELIDQINPSHKPRPY